MNKTKIVAEAGLNHNGDFSQAKEMIRVAKECGAHVVKFQYFDVDVMCLNRDDFSNYDRLKRLCPRPQWIPLLKKECDRVGIEFACTPFCEYSAQDIAPFVKSFKVASPEVCNTVFVSKLASYGKPLILSTGKATQNELDYIFRAITDNVVLLYCVSKYPAVASDYDLDMIAKLCDRYHVPVGLSDHTQDILLSIEAIRAGACMVERHFKIEEDCIDSAVSLNPSQLKELCGVACHRFG